MTAIETRRTIRLSKSCLGPAEKAAVLSVLDREYLGMGVEVRQFEDGLSAFFGRPAVCVVNGTASIHLAVQGCGLGRGDEVLAPSLTYVASFQAIAAAGATPVACDIDERTLMIDWRDAERRLTDRTRAIMPVHYAGGAEGLDDVYAFAGRHGLRVIEDAAHAFGSSLGGRRIGSFGDISCFSFDGIKNITSGEGGCVVSADQTVLRRVRDARLLGVEKDSDQRYAGQRSWEFDVTAQGWRYHMSNVMAAIGLAQLARAGELAGARQRLARQYDDLLLGHARIRPVPRDYNEIVPHIYVVRIRGLADRPSLRAALLREGIETGLHYQPNHHLTYFRQAGMRPLAVTDAVFPELLSLPLHPDMTGDDVVHVCRTLTSLVA